MTIDLAKLRAETQALIDGTTPGPWSVFINDAGDEWTGWPLSVSADNIEDKTIIRPGGHWPYEWDAKTSQHEACQNARLIAAAPTLAADTLRLLDEIERLRTALEQIAKAKYGLQSIMEDYSDTNAFNYQAMQYWRNLAQGYEATARAALAAAPQPAPDHAEDEFRVCLHCGVQTRARFDPCWRCGLWQSRLVADGYKRLQARVDRSAPQPAPDREALDEIERLRGVLNDIASGKYSGIILPTMPPKDPAVEAARAALAKGGPDDR